MSSTQTISTGSHLLKLNRKIENRPIKSSDASRDSLVVLQHAKSHAFALHIRAAKQQRDFSLDYLKRQSYYYYCSSATALHLVVTFIITHLVKETMTQR